MTNIIKDNKKESILRYDDNEVRVFMPKGKNMGALRKTRLESALRLISEAFGQDIYSAFVNGTLDKNDFFSINVKFKFAGRILDYGQGAK